MQKEKKREKSAEKYCAAGENFAKKFKILPKLRSNFYHFPKFVTQNVAKLVSILAKNLTK